MATQSGSAAPLIAGALDRLARLLDLGYDPRVCTLTRNPQAREGKLAWQTC